jgi:hypothetical protein
MARHVGGNGGKTIHIAMDAGTGDVRAVEFTSSRHCDSPLLPELLAQIPPETTIGTVTADGAYDTDRCHGAIIDRGADAVIPIHRNGRTWNEERPTAVARNEILRATRHLARTLEEVGRLPRPKPRRGPDELPEALR